MPAYHSRRAAAAPVVMLLALLLAGCSGPPRSGESAEVGVRTLDEAGFAEVLRQSRGNVVLIDFWATWCTSCIELFPHTVELHEKYADRGLTVISISLDDPEETAAVFRVLEDNGATFANYISQFGAGEKSLEIFAMEDGTLPYFKLYDRQGNLHKTFASGSELIEPQQIDRAIEELLGED